MSKKIYSGVYLFENKKEKSQFGSVDASFVLEDKKDIANLIFRKKDLTNFFIDEDFISLKVNLEQLQEIGETLLKVSSRIQYLKLLHQTDKSNANAYLDVQKDEKT